MAAIEWRLDGDSNVVIWVGAAIMKWRFGSVKGKTRRFWRGCFWKKQMGVLKEGSGRLVLKEEGEIFLGNTEGS
jgi:hypothetical protein